jgi:hypothetical protein
MTQDFFTEVHLLADKLVLIVAIRSLRGSHASWHHTPNAQSGATQPTQDEDHTSHKQSTRVPFGSPPGKGQEPQTVTNLHLTILAAPSRLGGGNKQIPQQNTITKCL